MTRKTSVIDIPKLNKQGKDYFGIDNYSEALTEFIRYSETPITIAIQGEWGSGKTSLMNYIYEQLCTNDREFQGIWLNTWEDSLLTHDKTTLINIITRILSEVVIVIEKSLNNDLEMETVEKLNSEKKIIIKENIKKIQSFVKSLTPILIKSGLQMLEVNPSIISIVDAIQTISSNSANNNKEFSEQENDSFIYTNIIDLRENISSAINNYLEINNEKGFIFFIDDLDRIEPTIAVDILEILKNIFTVENCVFVLAIDYEVVVKGLQEKFGERSNVNEREYRSFFDKIIQVPFTMPVSNYEIGEFLFDKLNEIQYFTKTDIDQELFVNQVCEIVEHSIGHNPRSLKRLINSLSLTKLINQKIKKDAENLHEEILHFALVCIQTAYPKIYDFLKYEPSFEKWKEEILFEFLGDGIIEISNRLKKDFFKQEWELALYILCSQDSYLSSKFKEIKKILLNIYNIIPEKECIGPVIEKALKMSSATDISRATKTNYIDIEIEANVTKVQNLEKGYFLSGFTINEESKEFYVWSVKTNKSVDNLEDVKIIDYTHRRDTHKKIEVLKRNFQDSLTATRLNILFMDESKEQINYDPYIKIFDSSYHPLIAMAYEIEDLLEVKVIEKLARTLSSEIPMNEKNTLILIGQILLEILDKETTTSALTKKYKDEILNEIYISTHLLDLISTNKFNIEVYSNHHKNNPSYDVKSKENPFFNSLSVKSEDDDNEFKKNLKENVYFYYLEKQEGRIIRSDKVLTFDPYGEEDTLYYERNENSRKDIDLPQNRETKEQVHTICCKIMNEIGRKKFLKPTYKANIYIN
ncbi:KAP family P-loop NTPase fold protein [Priestia megaterium]|uniref:KAP family P-loop NTPase fold protein n=1 Tax=Priestia megaterium TaxID=1404 RepID=UPI00159BC1E2|nr:P-loop NTPase fold protein [Priestia megaterium]